MSFLNRAYARDEGRCFGPVYFPEEPYNFFINKPISDPDFANFKLNVRPLGTTVFSHTDIAPLQRRMIDTVNYYIYAEFAIPAGTPFGWYELVIYDPTVGGGTVKAVSNKINVEKSEDVENTALIAYRHKTNLYGFDYETDPSWYNKVRFPLIHYGFNIDKDLRQYRNVTNRRLRNLKSYKDEVVKIQSYKFDEDGHRAISSIYDHDTIFLNTTFIVPKTAYVIDINPKTVVTNGEIDVIVDTEIAPPSSILDQVREYSDEHSEEFD